MSRAKGRRSLNKVIDHYVDKGYVVDEVELTGKYRKYKDLFAGYCLNCWQRVDECCDRPDRFDGFDLVAIKFPVIALLQVKTNQPVKQAPMKKFAGKFASSTIHVICATWYSYKGLRVQQYTKDGKIIESDYRK